MTYLILFIVSLSTCVTTYAQQTTTYRWINKGKKLSDGKCFEVDELTLGKNYSAKVSAKYCRPKEVEFAFNFKRGHCIEVDSLSGGKSFYLSSDIRDCKTMPVQLFLGVINNNFGCYEVDQLTQGKKYYHLVSKDLCTQLQTELFWKAKDNERGECYTKDKSGKYKKISTKTCKPDQTKLTFKRTGPTSGKCLEQDINDSKLYSARVNTKRCKVDKTEFLFYKSKTDSKGNCYEVDQASKGNLYLNKVKIELCK